MHGNVAFENRLHPWKKVFFSGMGVIFCFPPTGIMATPFEFELFVDLNHINVPVQHMQAIGGQTETC